MEQLEMIFTNTRKRVNKPDGDSISDEFRGYSWHDLIVPIELRLDLPFNMVAYKYCDSGRYLYFKKILKLPDPKNYERLRGDYLDSALLGMITDTAKYLNMMDNPQCMNIHSFLHELGSRKLRKAAKELEKEKILTEQQKAEIFRLVRSVLEFECCMMAARIQYLVAKTRDVTISSLHNLAIPILVENRITARDMGISEKMTPDFVFAPCVLGDFKSTKFDSNNLSYRIAVTGYALAYEKTNHADVDVGCILHLDVDRTRETPLYELDAFVIKDEYRKAFITQRNMMLSMVHAGKDPGLASKCPSNCPFLKHCNPPAERIVDITK